MYACQEKQISTFFKCFYVKLIMAASHNQTIVMNSKNEMAVYIPKPCHESWDNMSPTQKGKFCNACTKEVVDFSLMSDNQVLNYFKNSTARVCGRFAEDQLQRSLQPATQPKKKAWWMAFTMPLLLLFDKSDAQNISKNDTAILTPQFKEPEIMGKVMVRNVDEIKDEKIIIEGSIKDENGNAVAYAVFFVKQKNLQQIQTASVITKLK